MSLKIIFQPISDFGMQRKMLGEKKEEVREGNNEEGEEEEEEKEERRRGEGTQLLERKGIHKKAAEPIPSHRTRYYRTL